jgi:hypothetical protein
VGRSRGNVVKPLILTAFPRERLDGNQMGRFGPRDHRVQSWSQSVTLGDDPHGSTVEIPVLIEHAGTVHEPHRVEGEVLQGATSSPPSPPADILFGDPEP